MTKKQIRRLALSYNRKIQQELLGIRHRKRLLAFMGVPKEIIDKVEPANLKQAWYRVKTRIPLRRIYGSKKIYF